MSEDNEDDKVGYKKPPKQHRFQPGVSGNPKGRKPLPTDMDGFMTYYMDQTVPVTENGRKTRRRRKQVIVIRTVNAAMEGKDRAIDRVMKHDREQGRPAFVVEPEDKAVVDAALRRLQPAPPEASPAPEPSNPIEPSETGWTTGG